MTELGGGLIAREHGGITHTDHAVASSDATNLKNTTATVYGDHITLKGHKWVRLVPIGNLTALHADVQWISGAGDPRNAVHIVLAVTDPSNPSPHKRHSLVVVDPKQRGVNVVRPMTVFGYDDAPEGHCEVKYDNVQLDVKSGVVGGRAGLGRGFEMIQARLGCVSTSWPCQASADGRPGRLHHCMRTIGVASRALDLLLLRVSDPARKTFGKQLREHGTISLVQHHCAADTRHRAR